MLFVLVDITFVKRCASPRLRASFLFTPALPQKKMERTFSVDDLIGNVYRLSGAIGGMGNRTDSEAAFQEFLKRIPSATNLSAAGSAGGAQYEPGALQQTAQQLLSGTGLPTSTLNASLSGDPAPGMPRVPSLDLLRQLVLQNSLGNSLSQPIASAALKTDALSTGRPLFISFLALVGGT